MRHPPIAPTPTLFHPLDVGAIAVELLASARTAADGKASRTLLKSDASTVVQSIPSVERHTRWLKIISSLPVDATPAV